MKFLQNLSTLAEKTKSLPQIQARQQTSEQNYQQGMQLLMQAQAQQFQDLTLLKQAAEHFLNAIRHNYRNPEPYISMAYLMILTEDFTRARNYLHEALRCDPLNEGALSMLQAMQGQTDLNPKTATSQVDDADVIYDRVEDMLSQAIRLISSMPPPVPSPEPEALKGLEQSLSRLQTNYNLILERFAELEQNLELAGLHARLRLIQNRLRQFEQACQTAYLMQDMREQILEETEAVRSLCQHLVYQPPQAAFYQLERILDACDAVADQLDLMEERGIDIKPLISDYRELKKMVLLLQDALDEMKNLQ